MTKPYEKLKTLLGELFQFDREDLDFGIYRIMNHRRDEIRAFLDKDLLPQVEQTFAGFRSGEEAQLHERRETLKAEVSTIAEQAALYGSEPEKNPRYGEASEELSELNEKLEGNKVSSRLEEEVYSDLYTFFRRYYKDGDFLSLRRYKPGVYAIPYEGEEVKLHWANADQYYVKTAENFRNYRFDLEGAGPANFDLVSAATERDNNKPQSGKDRRFVLREEDPVEEADGELHIFFEYRPHSESQKNLNSESLETIFENVPERWKEALSKPAPTASDKNRTLLQRHLDEYTAKNSFDYFIHKDLGGFLRRELDFYLKSEVLHIDDLDTENEVRVEQYLSKLKVIKRTAGKLIAFLAQMEDFQKKLFLKKKFVVSSDYCLTLDNVPEELYGEIVGCDAQYEEWENLFSISGIEATLENGNGEPRTTAWLAANPHLVLDTKFFDRDFKDRLLASIEDLDEKTDGLLINSENFQALELLQERYQKRLNVVFIDPPYNTGLDGFIYKDSYQHSSWLSMMNNRLEKCIPALAPNAIFLSVVDFVEVSRLRMLLDQVFGERNFLADIAWEKRYTRSNNAKRFYSLKDTVLAYRNSEALQHLREARSEKSRSNYTNPDNDPRGSWISSSYVNPATKEARRNLVYSIKNPFTGEEKEHPTHAWKYDTETYASHVDDKRLYWGLNGDYEFPRLKSFLSEASEGMVPIDIWHYKDTGTTDDGGNEVKSIFGSAVFDNPKPTALVRRVLQLDNLKGDGTIISDFFAGSGTTGHAVINLNREDGGDRKYILVEMGEYFDTVLKPRVLKVIYSKDWRGGKPVSREGTSHILKYMTLESYEDTLNNLSLKRTQTQEDLIESDPALREEYMLRYMLDFETKGSPSLLDLDSFRDPSSYALSVARGDEIRSTNVDLIETFDYLLGLTVSRRYVADDFRVVEGENPAGEKTLVIWRNTEEKTNDDLDAFFRGRGYPEAGFEHVYTNGDSTLALHAGGAKTHLIEEEFGRLMFEPEGA